MKPKNLRFSPTGIQLVIGFLGLVKGSLGQIQGRAAIEHNLGFLKVSLYFLQFYLCYDLLEVLLRQGVKPNGFWYVLNNYFMVFDRAKRD